MFPQVLFWILQEREGKRYSFQWVIAALILVITCKYFFSFIFPLPVIESSPLTLNSTVQHSETEERNCCCVTFKVN
jgi:hypothetical protein